MKKNRVFFRIAKALGLPGVGNARRARASRRLPAALPHRAGRPALLASLLWFAATLLWTPPGAAQQTLVTQEKQGAVEQQTPPGFFLGTQLATGYDSNLARQAPGRYAIGTQVDQAAVLASFDHTYERQHVYAFADIGRNVYLQLPFYDFTSQNAYAGLQSTFPGEVVSDIKFSHYVVLANQSDVLGLQRNIVTESRVDSFLRVPLGAQWRAILAAGGGHLRNSNELDVPTDVNSVQLEGGFRYEAGSANYVDLLVRSLQARYPELNLLPPTDLPVTPYHERSADLQTKWRFSGSSQVIGNLGYVERRSEDVLAYWRNFSGPAYDLTYLWTPGAKFRFTMLGRRATGEPGDNDYLSAVTHLYRLTPSYLPSDHLRVEAEWEWSAIHYASIPQPVAQLLATTLGVAPAPLREDILRSEGLVALWTPRKWFQVRASLRREVRNSNIEFWSYTDRVARLQLQARF